MAWIPALLVLSACMCACTGDPPPLPPERAPEIDATPGIDLVHAPFHALSIPPSSLDELPESVELAGWKQLGPGARGGYLWEVPTPFRPRGMFFFKPQPGLEVRRMNGTRVPFRLKGGGGGLSWKHDEKVLTVHTREAEPPPPLELLYPRAREREGRLHFATAKAAGLVTDEEDFVRNTTVQEGWTSRTGLLLPAPARASYRLTLPEAAHLSIEPGLVRPELQVGAPSDGCTLKVQVTHGETTHELLEKPFQPGQFTLEDLDLSKWAGQEVELSFSTLPGATTRYDLCFVGSPRIYKKKEHPRRVLMVFVDTLRPDHLSTYGYHRETTPHLDQLARRSVVFEQARSIAPWTLPSARTVITGYQPELYDSAPTLPGLLSRQGFATGMIAGNVYLSANFDMNRDWGHHEVDMFPPADVVTDRALDWLAEHEGQDALLQVHYMSAHLPYLEPEPYRSTFADGGPPGFQSEFHLPAVRTGLRNGTLDDDGKAYIADRYDNCILWIDNELQRLYAQLAPEDVLVVFSDHGEEFWDHGGYEHGHTLYEELLRVPLVIKAPGLQAGRVQAPVSLLDVAPTILDLLDVEGTTQGVSLVAAARGDQAALQALQDRTQAIGRPLYGREQWGVITEGHKWTTHEGRERLYDLKSDPTETADLAQKSSTEPYRQALGEALNTPAGVAYRFVPTRNSSHAMPVEVTVKIPGGVDRAWMGADPLQRSSGHVDRLGPDEVKLTWHEGFRGVREAYVLPVEPPSKVTHTLQIRSRTGEGPWRDAKIPEEIPAEPGKGKRPPLTRLELQNGKVYVTWGIAPAVDATWRSLDATDSETADWLEKLGYAEPEKAP